MIKILGSIKDVSEAKVISKYDFDIIDIKNVMDGALGYVGDDVVDSISKMFKNKTLSVTAGNDLHPNSQKQISRLMLMNKLGVKYIKIGVYGVDNINEHKAFLKSVSGLSIKVVGVMFAEYITNESQIDSFCELDYHGLMIDTENKNAGSSIDILPDHLIEYFTEKCRQHNKLCGISGSLSSKNLEKVFSFSPNFIGLRGAICSQSKRETIDSLNCEKVLEHFKRVNQKMHLKAV